MSEESEGVGHLGIRPNGFQHRMRVSKPNPAVAEMLLGIFVILSNICLLVLVLSERWRFLSMRMPRVPQLPYSRSSCGISHAWDTTGITAAHAPAGELAARKDQTAKYKKVTGKLLQ